MISVKWIDSECSFEPHHYDCKAKGIEPRMKERKIVTKGRKSQTLFRSDLRELGNHFRSNIHTKRFAF